MKLVRKTARLAGLGLLVVLWATLVGVGCPSSSTTTTTEPPSNLTADGSVPCLITLDWDFADVEIFSEDPEEEGFRIERRVGDSGSWKYVGTAHSSLRKWVNAGLFDSSLEPGVTYCYRAAAYNETIITEWSNIACAEKK